MKMEDANGKRLFFNWDNIFSEGTQLPKPDRAIVEEIIIRPLIQKGIFEFREKWNIPATTGFSSKSDLENKHEFQKGFDEQIRKKFGFPEYLSKLIMHFVLYGEIQMPEKLKENLSLRKRIEHAVSVAKYFGNEGHFMYRLEGVEEINTDIFDFSHEGITVGIDADSFSVVVRQSVTARFEVIDELKDLIEGYREALRTHQVQLRDNKNSHGHSFLIHCLIYRAIVEERLTSNREILGWVQTKIEEELKLREGEVEKMAEFKISEKTHDENTFFTRVKRLKKEILGRDIESD